MGTRLDLVLEFRAIVAERVVDESDPLCLRRADRLTCLGQLDGLVGAYATWQRVRPVLRAVQPHGFVVRIQHHTVRGEDLICREGEHGTPGSSVAAQSGDDELSGG